MDITIEKLKCIGFARGTAGDLYIEHENTFPMLCATLNNELDITEWKLYRMNGDDEVLDLKTTADVIKTAKEYNIPINDQFILDDTGIDWNEVIENTGDLGLKPASEVYAGKFTVDDSCCTASGGKLPDNLVNNNIINFTNYPDDQKSLYILRLIGLNLRDFTEEQKDKLITSLKEILDIRI